MAHVCMDVQPPPWLFLKSKYIHMSMLIQEELHTLWKTPTKTWDASKGEYFYMRAVLIMTVHDYLGTDMSQARCAMDIADARDAWMIQHLSS